MIKTFRQTLLTASLTAALAGAASLDAVSQTLPHAGRAANVVAPAAPVTPAVTAAPVTPVAPAAPAPPAQPDLAPATASRAEQTLLKAVEEFRAAMISGDGRVLTRLADPRLTFGHSNGLVQSRDEFVRSVLDKSEIFREIKLVDQKVDIYGRTAVSRHEFHADILLKGKPLNVKLKCIEVWDRTARGWRLVSRQAYKTS